MADAPVKVLCVEDNDLVAGALERKLQSDPRFSWCGMVATMQELQERLATVTPDVVSMDWEMPGQDTPAMINAIRRRAPDARVLILTGHVDGVSFQRAFEAGVWGFISKAEDSRVIVDSICRIAAGQRVFDPGLMSRYKGPMIPDRSQTDGSENPTPRVRRWSPLRLFGRKG